MQNEFRKKESTYTELITQSYKQFQITHMIDFLKGDIHKNRNGFYKVEAVGSEEVLCRYFHNNETFRGRKSSLSKIEHNLLGFNYPSIQAVRAFFIKRDIDMNKFGEVELLQEMTIVQEFERKEKRLQSLKKLYESRLTQDGVEPSQIHLVTRSKSATGCHKCKKKLHKSGFYYECSSCRGMVCRSCGSCLCNRVQGARASTKTVRKLTAKDLNF